MKINLEKLTDELILRANVIEAIDPATRRAFQIWCRESWEKDYPGTRIDSLIVYLPYNEFGQLKNQVRAVKGRLPALVESLRL
jgi:hypothetical protein